MKDENETKNAEFDYRYMAIQRRKDNAFVAGSDFRYSPPHCIMADDYRPPLLLPLDYRCIKTELARRKINMERYKTVIVEIKEVERAEFLAKEFNMRCKNENTKIH